MLPKKGLECWSWIPWKSLEAENNEILKFEQKRWGVIDEGY